MQHYVPLILIFRALGLNAISGFIYFTNYDAEINSVNDSFCTIYHICLQFSDKRMIFINPCFCDLDIRYNLPRLQKVKLVWTGHEAKYDFYCKPRVAYAFYVVKSLMSPCLIFV